MATKTAPQKGKKTLTPAQFERLSKKSKRMLVLQDVILQAGMKNINIARGCYLSVKNLATHNEYSSARDSIMSNSISCTVCARGAMFLSTVKFRNKLTIEEFDNAYFDNEKDDVGEATEFMSSIYNGEEQAIIETIFEGRIGILHGRLSNDLEDKAIAFRMKLVRRWLTTQRSIGLDRYILVNTCKHFLKHNGEIIL